MTRFASKFKTILVEFELVKDSVLFSLDDTAFNKSGLLLDWGISIKAFVLEMKKIFSYKTKKVKKIKK